MEEALQRQGFPGPDAVLFLGDGLSDLARLQARSDPATTAFLSVAGNCDWFSAGQQTPQWLTPTFEGIRIWMLHGHSHGVKSGYGRLIAAAAERGVDLVCFGHTHQPCDLYLPVGTPYDGPDGQRLLEKPLRLFNPGSIREGSFGLLTLRDGQLLSSHGSL
jgi:hypothetical protein